MFLVKVERDFDNNVLYKADPGISHPQQIFQYKNSTPQAMKFSERDYANIFSTHSY